MSDLAKKLGIKSGHIVCLLDATPETAALLRQACQAGARLYDRAYDGRCDILMFWPSQLDGLAELFARLQYQIVPAGAIWAVIPKKPFARARGIEFSWAELQAAGLRTDLVDNKIVSLGDQEYATRFVIRKERRNDYA